MKISSYEATTLNVPEDDPLANMPEEAGRKRPSRIANPQMVLFPMSDWALSVPMAVYAVTAK